MEELIARAAGIISRAQKICVLTGAGISAESGLSTFRDEDGLWNNYPVEDVATPEGFARDPQMVWKFYYHLRLKARAAKPNPAHKALAYLEKNPTIDGRKRTVTVLTQNVDGLHGRAGSGKVIELHGSLWRVRCLGCVHFEEDEKILLSETLPKCPDCGNFYRPDIVWFGEQLSYSALSAAEEAVRGCEVFITIGTAAQVFPAAGLTYMAVDCGKAVLEVNLEKTPASKLAFISLQGKAGEILPKIAGMKGSL